jgi:hypothetical protein
MDLAISIAILLASAVSLAESFSGGQYVNINTIQYFGLLSRNLKFKGKK